MVEYFESIEHNELELISSIKRIAIDLSLFPSEGGKGNLIITILLEIYV